MTSRDWIQNLNCRGILPKEVKDFSKEGAKMHKGFCNYLFKYKTKNDIKTKYERIVTTLEEIYTCTKPGFDNIGGFSLHVTGHSLGGAIAQILAFTLAGSNLKFLPEGEPVRAITYASPECGDSGYVASCIELEKAGKLRHIRVTNQGDAVPIAFHLPPFSTFEQPGVNIHVYEDQKALVEYNKVKMFFFNPFKALDRHMPLDYRKHLFDVDENKDLVNSSTREFYEKYAKTEW